MDDQPATPQTPEQVPQEHWEPPAYITTAYQAKPGWAMTSKQRRTYGIIGGAMLGVLILACVIVGVNGAGADSSTTASGSISAANTAQNQTPIPTATPKPTATPNPNTGLAAYIAAVQPDTQIVTDDLGSVGNDCGASDLAACDSDLQTLSDDVHHFQSDLDDHPAPPCLASVDSDLRTALQLFDKGAQSARAGIKQNDPTLIDTGSSYFSQGNRYIKDATDGLKTAGC